MSAVKQQALLIAEAWQNLYNNISYVDFQSYSQDNIVNAILNYVQVNYPDSFNDWIANSEFVIKVRTLAWLHQNISYRIDLSVRENFIQTATRRDSILMLAQNVFYKPNRVTAASGELRIDSIRTTQPIVDSNGDSMGNVEIFWNDPANPDWFEQFTLVMNAALTPRTQFGRPLVRYNSPPTRADLYMFNSRAPSSGVHSFNVQVASANLEFGWINVSMEGTTGVLEELAPNSSNAQRILYRSDGRGSSSPNTGFFLPVRQGVVTSLEKRFDEPQPLTSVVLGTANVDNRGVFVQQIDDAGTVTQTWIEVDSLYGQGVAFNTLNSDTQKVFETLTLQNDQVEVQFGDGKFGAIPTDRFRFWYRTVNPTPVAVQPLDIQKQTFTIPYVNNGTLYFITIRASLYAPITNALPTDSNDAIRDAIGGSFQAQNRMVTAKDYNLFPLQDSSILKVNAVNRTYSGHSEYSKITDPTGFYDGVKLLAEDGRLYRDDTAKSQYFSSLTSKITLDEIVQQYLVPIIQSSDKANIYYTSYDEFICVRNAIWHETSETNGISSGYVTEILDMVTTTMPVGDTATDELQYLMPGTLIRYDSLSGPFIGVRRISGDGTGVDGITLTGVLADGTVLYSLMPVMRNHFTNDEATEIKTQLHNLQEFGISWNQTTQSWDLITNANLNKSGGNFSIAHQGDTTNTGKDASWMAYFRYIPTEDQWELVDRGMGIYFESAREIEFGYVNTIPMVDPTTGKFVRDNINILGVNEGRDSLHRLGLYQIGACCPLIYDFTSDGSTKCYEIRNRADIDHLVVLVDDYLRLLPYDFSVIETPVGDEVCFLVAPTLGSTISIRVSESYVFVTQYLVRTTADGVSTFYTIGTKRVNVLNTFLSLDGVTQDVSDYSTPRHGTNAGFVISPVLPSGTVIQGYAAAGPTTDVFDMTIYIGDGITAAFDVGYPLQTVHTILVFMDGIWQMPNADYTISESTNSIVTFVTPPAVNVEVCIHIATNPHFVRSAFYTGIGTGSKVLYKFPSFSNLSYRQVMVGWNGVIQQQGDYTISSLGVTFAVAPPSGMRIDVFVLYGALGFNFLDQNNTCYTTYLLDDQIWDAIDVEHTPDGYVDLDGIKVAPFDSNFDGLPDNPYAFDDIIIPDGVTDRVLWRAIVQDGFTVWNPIDQTTVPKGTYGFFVRSAIQADVQYDQTKTQDGDIHLNQTTNTWLVADGESGYWRTAAVQSNYKTATGRSGLKFIWTHYPADDTRIDPAISNIIDLFILPVSYDTAYRDWISSGFDGDEPASPTSESLQNEYGYLNDYRMTDDSILFHPIRYRPLFGIKAEDDLQGTFLAIKAPNSSLSDNDLVLRVIDAIDRFFEAKNWELGETFYLTKLISYIHRLCVPDLQSVVLTAKDGSAFGDLFQVRSASDELFISVAQPSDIRVVSGFNADNLQINGLI